MAVNRRLNAIVFAIPAVLIVLILFIHMVFAHDRQRPELDDWFNKLKSGHYKVRLKGQWVDVPDDAVLNEPNRDGRTWVWPVYMLNSVLIRCFIPGPMT